MNIGMIIYSQTGHTLSVAEKLQEELTARGHTVNMEQITISGEASPGKKNFQFTAAPSPEPYEAVIFGSPVQAFSLSVVMEEYLKQLSSLEGKKVAFLITKHLPFYWTGANRALGQMKSICEGKGAEVLGSGVAIWSGSRRERTTKSCVEELSRLF